MLRRTRKRRSLGFWKPTAELVSSSGVRGRVVRWRLERARAKIDDRFDPRQALAGTVRYLEIAEQHLGRTDLAFESYHMGVGNLQRILDLYDGGHAVPYPQLYFDTAPDHNPNAYALISSFGDDSSLYYWRLLGAQRIMRLYRTDRGALRHRIALQTATCYLYTQTEFRKLSLPRVASPGREMHK